MTGLWRRRTYWPGLMVVSAGFSCGSAEPGLQEFLTDLGGDLGVAVIGIQLDHQPAVIPNFADSGKDAVEIEVALAERPERNWFPNTIFEMDVCDAIRECQDQCRRVAAAGRQVRGVGAEGDATMGE